MCEDKPYFQDDAYNLLDEDFDSYDYSRIKRKKIQLEQSTEDGDEEGFIFDN